MQTSVTVMTANPKLNFVGFLSDKARDNAIKRLQLAGFNYFIRYGDKTTEFGLHYGKVEFENPGAVFIR